MAGSLDIEIPRSQLIKMAMAADRTINVSGATIAAKANNIIAEAGLHGTMTVAYAIVTHSAIVVLSAVRIERVLRVACSGGGFGRVRQEVVAISPSIGTAGLMKRWPSARLSPSVFNFSRGCCESFVPGS